MAAVWTWLFISISHRRSEYVQLYLHAALHLQDVVLKQVQGRLQLHACVFLCLCVSIFVCVFECAFVWVCNCVSSCLYMFVCSSAYVFECVMCVWVCATQTATFRNNISTHLQYHLAQTTQSSVYKNAPNCDVENSVIFCAEHRTDSLRNYGGKKWERMIKDAAIRGLSALSVSCTIRRDAPVARHISVLLSPYFFLVAPTHKTQFRYWMWDSN